jgi:hypothetical protein
MNRFIASYLIFYSSFIEVLTGSYNLRLFVLVGGTSFLFLSNIGAFRRSKLTFFVVFAYGCILALLRSHHVFDLAFFVFWPINAILFLSNDISTKSKRDSIIIFVLSFIAFTSVYYNLEVSSTTRQLSVEGLSVNGLSYACLCMIAYHSFLLLSPILSKNIWTRLHWFSLLLYIGIIFQMQSRMALLIAVSVFFLVLYKKFNRNYGSGLKRISFISFLVISAILALELDLTTNFLEKRFFVGSSDLSLTNDRSILERLDMYNRLFEEKDAWFFSLENYRPYPHNLFVELIMRLGLVGVMLCFFFISAIRKALRNIKSPEVNLLAILFLVSVSQAMSSLSLEMNRGLFLGAALYYNKNI